MLVAALTLAGCYVQDQPRYGPAGTVDGNVDLVAIDPGVEVVADYGVPIFYADDLYWRSIGGVWYESSWYGGGWRRSARPSPHVVRIDRPDSYTHYRPQGYVRGGHATQPTGTVRTRPAPRGGRHR